MSLFDQEHIRYWAVIPAAGLGLRMGAALPKQYLTLNGKTVLEHSLAPFISHPRLSKIVLVLHAQDTHWSALQEEYAPHILTAIGGATRAHSVFQGLTALLPQAQTDDWVLVHDAVRPCIRVQDIDRLISQLNGHPVGGILGTPAADTLKLIGSDYLISQTIPRDNIWLAQTPQIFRFQLLYDCLAKVLQQGLPVTDEANAIECCGLQPRIVQGNPQNIKITHPADLLLAEQFLTVPAQENV